ncbi:hypothetical protein MTX78_23000 [Hymenobacter tibetensis]|uniref:STAS/SEC14 domain-containing protein n=1 Tax=Hymenobacter tibetensis TaxID=497967 RepID=A0ABY4D0I3_9BACT|nr:hypothetical protein [Hymenobacter tibetensis]UOG74970.1 hypothetical protein MTX78_23000 [Hymenobacter tibetensis]
MLVTNLEYLHLSHRPDLGQVFLRWTRPATSQEHRSGYQAALELAQREKVGRWLVDLRSRGLADPIDFRWVVTSFREQLTSALPGVRPCLAYLVLPYHAETLSQRLAEEMATDSVSDSMAMRVFTEEQAAQEWLQSRS